MQALTAIDLKRNQVLFLLSVADFAGIEHVNYFSHRIYRFSGALKYIVRMKK